MMRTHCEIPALEGENKIVLESERIVEYFDCGSMYGSANYVKAIVTIVSPDGVSKTIAVNADTLLRYLKTLIKVER